MANFLITSPNSLTEGTTSNDLIVLQTAGLLGSTVYGNDGNDLITADSNGNGVNAILNGQQGNDTINVASSANFTLAKLIGGGGNDTTVFASGVNATLSTIHGGGGADTITIESATLSSSTINGNAGLDLINLSTGASVLNSTLVALGAGGDTLNMSATVASGTTIAAGGGNDLVSANALAASAFRVEGDTVGDSEFYGNDTIRLGGAFGISALVQGGGGADIIQISGNIDSGSTVNGNAGKDSIVISGLAGSGNLIGGGAGSDTISVTGAIASDFGTIFGGGEADVISVVASNAGAGGTIIGGEGADTIGFGANVAGATINSRYTTFADSNIAAFDQLSGAVVATGFVISQTVVSGSIATGLNVGGASGFTTNDAAFVSTWGANVGGGVTARTTVLDQFLVAGQAVSFQDSTGNNYIFIQAGAAGSGTSNDLLVGVNQSASLSAGFVGGTAISVTLT